MAKQKKLNDYSDSTLINEISSLSYKESLDALDLVLSQLQKESVPLEEIEQYYLKAKMYLEHCEKLLGRVEQKILTLEASDLKACE